MSVFAKRLKQARQRAGLSLEKLGFEAGLDPASARTRMSRYELGKRVPDAQVVEQLAAALKLPVAYFYAAEEDEADLLLKYHQLPKRQRPKVIAFIDELTA